MTGGSQECPHPGFAYDEQWQVTGIDVRQLASGWVNNHQTQGSKHPLVAVLLGKVFIGKCNRPQSQAELDIYLRCSATVFSG
jgi:hypothetical protein